MGMFTELIFGAALKKDTPQEVIDSIKYMAGQIQDQPKGFPFEEQRLKWLFTSGGSYYFGVHEAVFDMKFDKLTSEWIISARVNLKNYEQEIQKFLEWIKPFISKGSGTRDFYAIVTYEQQEEPTIHYLRD